MDLRLPHRWLRRPAAAGRHVRVLPVVGVPGAAATIVSSASLDPRVTGAHPSAPGPDGDLVSRTFAEPAPTMADEGRPRTSVLPAPGPDGRHDGVPGAGDVAWDVPLSSVGLVFADGASVELDPADPRVRTFRAAVAALLDAPTP